MLASKHVSMTVETFLSWADQQVERYELADGEPIAMAPERRSHGRMKGQVFRRLQEEIERKGLPCEVLVDSMGVKVDATFDPPGITLRDLFPPETSPLPAP